MTLTVRAATAAEVRPLRNIVLRGRVDWPAPDYDNDPDAVHLAAVDGDRVVGTATVFPSPYDQEPAAWQLRGMAVDPSERERGVGRLVVDAAVRAARDAGAPLLWAHARVTALGFYERTGWQVVGEEYEHGPSRLPHKLILLPLS